MRQLKALDKQVGAMERQIKLWHGENKQSRKLEQIAGIGPITASAFVATVGDAKSFKNARQVPAWLRMVPRRDGTGGKVTLSRIIKRGDVYLRTMLIHGARSVIAQIERKLDQADEWLKKAALKDRFNDPASGLGKAYLRLLVGEIKLDGNELVVRGSHRRLADAIGFMQKKKLGEVPSFVNDWRARQDWNLRALAKRRPLALP